MTHKKRETNVRSTVWNQFHEIFENEKKIVQYVLCTRCKDVIFRSNNNTNTMLRHICNTNVDNNNVLPEKLMKSIVSKEDKERLKLAASKFVIKDIRPYFAVQGKGLLDLCFACFEFGKKIEKPLITISSNRCHREILLETRLLKLPIAVERI